MPWGDALDTGHSSRSPCHGELALASDRPPISHGDGHELQPRNLNTLLWGKARSRGAGPSACNGARSLYMGANRARLLYCDR